MDEYIKREAAIEAVKHAWAKGLEPSQYLEIIPAVDAVPVVRCWKCKYHEDTDVTGFKHCCLIDKTVRYNDFCSYGKRKGGAD